MRLLKTALEILIWTILVCVMIVWALVRKKPGVEPGPLWAALPPGIMIPSI